LATNVDRTSSDVIEVALLMASKVIGSTTVSRYRKTASFQ
jgi:hypothetical protein